MFGNKKETVTRCQTCTEPGMKAFESPSNKGRMENGCGECGDHYDKKSFVPKNQKLWILGDDTRV